MSNTNLQSILEEIDLKKEELEALRPIKPEYLAKIQQKFRLEINFHSNKIEGNSLTMQETRSLLLFDLVQGSAKRLRDYEEMKGHNQAIKYLEEVIKDKVKISESLIRELNKILLVEDYYKEAITADGESTQKLIHVGVYKKDPNHVKTATGEIFRFAEPFEVPAKMQELLDWYELNKDTLHPLEFISQFHHKFIIIHPFDDGNGRTCRLLMNLILQNKGLTAIWIPENERQKYYNCLRLADTGNIEELTIYLGERLLFSLDLMIRGAKGEDISEVGDIVRNLKLKLSDDNSKNYVKKMWLFEKNNFAEFIEDNIVKVMENVEDLVFVASEKFTQMVSLTRLENNVNISISDVPEGQKWTPSLMDLADNAFHTMQKINGYYSDKPYPKCFVGSYRNGEKVNNSWIRLIDWYKKEEKAWKNALFLEILYKLEGFRMDLSKNIQLKIIFSFGSSNWIINIEINNLTKELVFKYGEDIDNSNIKELMQFIADYIEQFYTSTNNA